MSLEQIVVGLLALGVGAAFCFGGFKYFLLLLPIWGFLVGFVFGSNAIFALSGAEHGFFASAIAVIVGLVVGALFAVLSYLYYYFAVILLGGALGYSLGIGLMEWLHLGDAQILSFIVGVLFAAAFAFAFMLLAMPAVLAIWGTAVGGAAAMVTGVALILDRIQLSSLNDGMIGALAHDTNMPWLWLGAGIVLAIAGAWVQINKLGAMAVSIEKSQYANPGMS